MDNDNEVIDDEVEYQIEIAKSIYIMCAVFLVFIVGMVIERRKPKVTELPV